MEYEELMMKVVFFENEDVIITSPDDAGEEVS